MVNAVLTQLDQLRTYSNILVLTTSNLTSTIDLAFIDRADLKQFIGEPTVEAIYEIYRMAIQELISVRIRMNSCTYIQKSLTITVSISGENNINLHQHRAIQCRVSVQMQWQSWVIQPTNWNAVEHRQEKSWFEWTNTAENAILGPCLVYSPRRSRACRLSASVGSGCHQTCQRFTNNCQTIIWIVLNREWFEWK